MSSSAVSIDWCGGVCIIALVFMHGGSSFCYVVPSVTDDDTVFSLLSMIFPCALSVAHLFASVVSFPTCPGESADDGADQAVYQKLARKMKLVQTPQEE